MSELPRVAAVILAAGASTRFGAPKQLLPVSVGDAKPLLQHTAETALAAPFIQVIVVLGCQAEQIRPAVASLPVTIVLNPRWAGGLSTSVRAGLRSVAVDAAAAVFLSTDQPGLTTRLLERLVGVYAQTQADAVVAESAGELRQPTLFDRRMFQALTRQRGDQGGRALLRLASTRVVAISVEDPWETTDIDTDEAYQRWLRHRQEPLSPNKKDAP